MCCGTVAGAVYCPAGSGGSGLPAGVRRKMTGVRIVRRDKMGECAARATGGREVEVMGVGAGAGRGVFLPVVLARASGAVK